REGRLGQRPPGGRFHATRVLCPDSDAAGGDRRHPRGRRPGGPCAWRVSARPELDAGGLAHAGWAGGLPPPAQAGADPHLRGAGPPGRAADDRRHRLPRLQRRRLRGPQETDRHPLPGTAGRPRPVAGRGKGGLSPTLVNAAVADARAALLELGGRESTVIAAAIEGLPSVPAFRVMATASPAARPTWAGLVDDLFERPLLKQARAGLRNALMSTLTGDTPYPNVFFSFADAVVLWHYGHTQERTGSARLDAAYDAMRRLLAGADHFLETRPPAEPDVQYFHRLRRIRLTRDNAYPMLRRAGRLLGAVEAELRNQKLHTVRGSILTSYVTFSAQVMAMARALRADRDAIDRADVLAALDGITTLLRTAPSVL